jgi:hypothetical protein
MKNKFSSGRLFYFFTPGIHGNVLAWVKPASAAQSGRRVNENILRWEQDGGPVLEAGHSFLQGAEHPLHHFPVVANDNKISGRIDPADVARYVDQPDKTSEVE